MWGPERREQAGLETPARTRQHTGLCMAPCSLHLHVPQFRGACRGCLSTGSWFPEATALLVPAEGDEVSGSGVLPDVFAALV